MIITKTHNEPNATPEEITPEQAIDYLEERGYYALGTVQKLLSAACEATLRTPWAFYDFQPCQ